MCGYDIETKVQSLQWKAHQVCLNVRFCSLHHEFFPQGSTVNKEYYFEVMSRLRKAIRSQCTELWGNLSWILHHDNAPAYTSMLVKVLQMWRFCSLFSSITLTCCIMNSCCKVLWSIRNTILKLWADCAKQFFRNVQNCGKTNHGFCTTIMHQLTHRCLCVSFWPNTKP